MKEFKVISIPVASEIHLDQRGNVIFCRDTMFDIDTPEKGQIYYNFLTQIAKEQRVQKEMARFE